MNVLIIDAQGGGIGRQLVAAMKKRFPKQMITAVGTNSAAASAMLKAGADQAATGENAVVVCSRNADLIIGPVGIVIADALLGEITPAMAVAVGQSRLHPQTRLLPSEEAPPLKFLSLPYRRPWCSDPERDTLSRISLSQDCLIIVFTPEAV